MKKIFIVWLLGMPLTLLAQTEVTNSQTDRVAELQAEAAAKAKAAQEAAEAAQKAAREAQEAAEKAAAAVKTTNLPAGEYRVVVPKEVEERIQSSKESSTENSNNWVVPETKKESAPAKTEKEIRQAEKNEKAEKNAPYLAEGAVPVVNGDVQWTINISAPGQSAQELYDKMFTFLNNMTQEDNQLDRSKVAIVNENRHSIAATFQEWMVFSQSFISLDRTKFSYVLQADCQNGSVQVTMSRINYIYEVAGKSEIYKAEEWITDKAAVNKKHTKLFPISGKFRIKTIDRKNEIFANIKEAVK